MFSSEAWLANPSSGFYNGVATQSLRFDDGSSAYLTRTPSSTGNRRTYTISCWVKRSDLNTTAYIFKANTGTGDALAFRNHSTGTSPFTLYWFFADTAQGSIASTAVFRDVSSWYHVVLAVDTTQSTDTNRLKMYVNGTLLELGITNYPQQNYDSTFNTQVAHLIGAYASGNSHYDGYMSEFNFVDGTALDPTSFGETKNGVWIPIKYTGSYGTNGFRLQFNQTGVGTASTSTIGADTSGNTNHYTSSGIVASDCNMPDSPENNFATFNSIYNLTAGSLSEGNLKVATGSSQYGPALSTFAQSSGKWYAEFAFTSTSGDTRIGGVRVDTALSTTYDMGNSGSFAYRQNDGDKKIDGTETSYGATWSASDIIAIALNLDDDEVTFYKNNVSQGTFSITGGEYFIALSDGDSGAGGTYLVNFGQDSSFAGNKTAQGNTDGNGKGDFAYAPPSGFLALCTSNLPEPTISPNADTQADDHFETILYSASSGSAGAGSSTPQDIGGLDFKPDWVWIKGRSYADAHALFDSSRGVGKYLLSNVTNAEGNVADTLDEFRSDGFGLGADSTALVNYQNNTYVAWNWKANGGTTSSNTDGSITSTVQANTTAGFSIVTYTGTGSSGATYGHGLTQAPQIVLTKERNNTRRWVFVTRGVGITDYQGRYLDDTLAFNDQSYNISNMSSTLITLGADQTNDSSSSTYVAYCFHPVEGYSKFGSYTGNGSADGTFVYTGFRPAWVMIKRTDTTSNWAIFDSTRDPINAGGRELFANEPNAEQSNSADWDFVSNGIKFRRNYTDNSSGGTFIYMAFAEAPFKYANAK